MKRTVILLLAGLLPWLVGELVNLSLLVLPVPMLLWNVLLLGLWGYLAYRLAGPGRSVWLQTVLLHLFGAVMLVMNLVQQLVVGTWWPGVLGGAPQVYFIPGMQIGFFLVKPFITMPEVVTTAVFWPGYVAAYILMIAASLVGAYLKNRR